MATYTGVADPYWKQRKLERFAQAMGQLQQYRARKEQMQEQKDKFQLDLILKAAAEGANPETLEPMFDAFSSDQIKEQARLAVKAGAPMAQANLDIMNARAAEARRAEQAQDGLTQLMNTAAEMRQEYYNSPETQGVPNQEELIDKSLQWMWRQNPEMAAAVQSSPSFSRVVGRRFDWTRDLPAQVRAVVAGEMGKLGETSNEAALIGARVRPSPHQMDQQAIARARLDHQGRVLEEVTLPRERRQTRHLDEVAIPREQRAQRQAGRPRPGTRRRIDRQTIQSEIDARAKEGLIPPEEASGLVYHLDSEIERIMREKKVRKRKAMEILLSRLRAKYPYRGEDEY